MAKLRSLSNAVLNRFAKWFSSAGGVWQTLIIVGGWVAAEYLHYVHDDNMFQLMAWLTIYSAITQPVLAYTNRQDTSSADVILTRIEQLEEKELAKLDSLLTGRTCPSCEAASKSTTIE